MVVILGEKGTGMNIGWPEGIWITLATITLLVEASVDGNPKTGKHSFAQRFMGIVITFALLYWGGFFD